MAVQVVTQLIVDSAGAIRSSAEFVAAMEKAKKAAVDAGNSTATSFDAAQKKMQQVMASNDPVFAAQLRWKKELERHEAALSKSVQLGQMSQVAMNAELAKTNARHAENVASVKKSQDAHTAYGQAMNGLQSQASMLSGRLGVLGSVLSALGPGGIAAAVGLAVLSLGFHQAATAALALADRAGKLKDFAETTGFSVIQLQALEKAGAQVGVSSESVTKGLERFSRQMVDVRKATGETYDQLRQVDAELALQVSRATSLTDAWDLVSKAILNAPLERANKIAVAFFGREGIQQTRLMRAGADAGGIAGLVSQLNVLDVILPQQAARWDELGDKIAENMKAAKQNVVSVFAEPTLTALNELSAAFLVLSRSMKEVSDTPLNDSWWTKLMMGLLVTNPLLKQMYDTLLRIRNVGKKELEAPVTRAASPVSFRFSSDSDADHAAAAAGIRERAGELIRLSNIEKERIEALGGAATALDKRVAKEKEIASLIAQFPDRQREYNQQLKDFNREQASNALSARIGLMGDMATVTDVATQSQNKINEAIKNSARFTDEEKRRIKERDVVRAEAASPDAQIGIQRQAIFLLEEEAQIRAQLLSWGKRWNSEEGERLAGLLRFNNQLKEIKDLASTSLAGFAKDIAAGVKPMDALVNQAKRLNDMLIDMAAKKLVTAAMGSIFGSAADVAGPTAGATSAAGILTTAGTTLAAQMIAGAEEAAITLGLSGTMVGSELVASGAATGTEVGAGGVVAGGALTAGGVAAGAAIWGPLALLMAAIAAGAALLSLGSSSDKKKQQQVEALQKQQEMQQAAISAQQRIDASNLNAFRFSQDTSTQSGALAVFDAESTQRRNAIANASAQEIASLEYELAAQRGSIVRDFASRAAADEARIAQERLEAEERAAQDRLEVERRAAARRLAIQDELFSVLNDSSTLGGQLSALEREFGRRRAEEQAAGGEALLDLEQLYFARRGQIQTDFNKRALEEQERAAQQQIEASNRAARTIVDYLNALNTGTDSALSPSARLLAARNTYLGQVSLAQGGNVEAAASITTYAEAYRRAGQDRYASGSGYQDILTQIRNDLVNLPQVTQSTDPIVQAIRDSIVAINLVKGSTDQVAGFCGTTATNTGGISQVITNTGGIATVVTNTAGIGSVVTNTAGIGSVVTNTAGIGSVVTNTAGIGSVVTNTAGIGSVVTNTSGISSVVSNTAGIGSVVSNTAAIQTVATNTGPISTVATNTGGITTIATNTGNGGSLFTVIDTKTGQVISNTGTALVNQDTTNDRIQIQIGQLNTLVNINNNLVTATSQLNSIINVLIDTRQYLGDKIYENIARTTRNTHLASGTPASQDRYALGGVVPPFSHFMAAEHSSLGPIMGRTGAAPLHITPGFPSGFANDNSALIAEVRALRAEVAALRREDGRNQANVGNAVVEKLEKVVANVKDGARRQSAATRDAAQMSQQAAKLAKAS